MPKKKIIFILAAIFACVQIFSSCSVMAVEKSKGLTVSPVRTEVDITPGTTIEKILTVENNSSKKMQVELSAEAFSVINEQYDYKFTAESKTANWINFSNSKIDLAPGQIEKVTYSISVPNSAEPGGQYLSVFATTDTPEESKAITSKQRIASLLYITVTGNITRTGKLIYLVSPWLINDNNAWSMSVQNTGTAHFRSSYSLDIYDLFGKVVKSSEKNSSLILPNTIRNVSGLVPIPNIPGIYKLKYEISMGDNPTIQRYRYFIYLPFWAILIVIIIIFAIIGFCTLREKEKAVN